MRAIHHALPTLAILSAFSVFSLAACDQDYAASDEGRHPFMASQAVTSPPPELAPAPGPSTAPALPAPTVSGGQLNIPGVVDFDPNAATIRESPASQSALNAALRALQVASPAITRLRIEGHTDNSGSPADSQPLSEKRANAVAAWLIGKGIDAKRLHPVGCGSKAPAAPNDSPENKAKNGRTEFDVEAIDGKKPDGYTDACATSVPGAGAPPKAAVAPAPSPSH